MPVLNSPYTTQDAADALGVDVRRTTAKLGDFAQRTEKLLAVLAPKGAAVHKARALAAYIDVASRLQRYDPDRLIQFLRVLAEGE